MPKIQNVSGEDRVLPWLGDRLVLAGQKVDVSGDDVYAYTQQAGWEPADTDAQQLHDAAETVAEALEASEDGSLPEPAGNASRDAWAGYVLSKNLATEDELAELTRDQIRDTYQTPQEG